MIDITAAYTSYFSFFDAYIMQFQQDGRYGIEDLLPENVSPPLDEDEFLVHIINAKPPNDFDLQDIVEDCETLLSLRETELTQFIQRKINNEPEEYTPSLNTVQSMIKKVKARALWQLGIPQGIDIEKDIIRLPGETIQPLTTLTVEELKLQDKQSIKVNAEGKYNALLNKCYGKNNAHPSSGLKHLAAYLHQDYAHDASEYLYNNPTIIEALEKFWGKSYTKNLNKIYSNENAIIHSKQMIAIQFIHFFSTIKGGESR